MSKYLWTKKHGDNYRQIYDKLSFKKIQDLTDSVQLHNYQVSQYPFFLLDCLEQIKEKTLRVAELGGYDGYQALTVMQSIKKQFTWTNFDISKISKQITQKELTNKDYRFTYLTQPFYKTQINEEFDLFYSSKMLEHIKLAEVLETLRHMRHCKYQIHIVDWFKNDDMHVIEQGSHKPIAEHLKSLGYKLNVEAEYSASSIFFAEKQQ